MVVKTQSENSLKWSVTVKWTDKEKSYTITTPRRYDAQVRAIRKFMKEFGLEGGPTLFLNKRKQEMEITTRASVDRRTFPRKVIGG